jgi:ATP-dependent helicase/nuclease subunit A
LEYVANLRDSGTREGEARATVGDAVQIMSVHAAKGLEFPLVVIGDVGYHRRSRNFTLIDDDLGLLLPLKGEDEQLPAAYRLGKFSADDQDEAESKRLFYVAATRAREKLILSGCFKLNKDNKPASLKGWLAQVAGPLGLLDETVEYNEEGAKIIHKPLQLGQTPVSCAIYEPGWTGKRRAHTAPSQAETPVPLPPPLLEPVLPGAALVDQRASEQSRIPPQRVWRVAPAVERPTAPAWVIGSLVHEALAAWRLPSPPLGEPALSLSKGTEGGMWFDRWATARAREYGLADPRQLAHAVRQSRRLLLRFGEHPLYAEMNSAQRRLHEVPYSRVTEGQIERGIIDAMYFHEGIWTIVEFKTDRVKDAHDFEKLLSGEDYVEQAQRYISAVEHLLGQRPRCVLCMLNYAGAVHLRWVGLREQS